MAVMLYKPGTFQSVEPQFLQNEIDAGWSLDEAVMHQKPTKKSEKLEPLDAENVAPSTGPTPTAEKVARMTGEVDGTDFDEIKEAVRGESQADIMHEPEELELARKAYREKFGKEPHHRLKTKAILDRVNANDDNDSAD